MQKRTAQPDTGAPRPAQIVCDSCEQNIASVFCFQCNGHLCDTCDKQIHAAKLLQKHTRTADFTPVLCKHHHSYTTMLCASC